MRSEKRCKAEWIGIGIAWLLGLLWLQDVSIAATLPEELHYRVSYQGVFSAGARVSIADIRLRSRRPAGAPYLESELLVSSAAYGAVEAFYPIRYHIRSWYWPDHSAVVASEYHEYGRPDDLEHKLILLDRSDRPFLTRNLLRQGRQVLSALEAGRYRPKAARGERRVFDRLGLLQAIRARTLPIGLRFTAMVSNGSKMMRYQVKVEKREVVRLDGRGWPALKLRIDGMERDARGRERPAHRPIYLWVSDEPRHIPLRAVARGAAGRIRIERVTPPVVNLAKRDGS
ncbi:MAG: DUF3108 domain-containing protein [Gammaproteobacteria bacterium]|nr:MAG: DUF3108 domain-containing protein [Gammaproteobacteria bacterium]